jgi:RNA polymerase sigma factor (sigma-70 family)
MSDASEFFLRNLPLIEQTIAAVCRRNGMSADEIEEFSAALKLRLIENDYAVIGAFQRRSSFAAYIAAVAARFLLDQRNKEWGKWRRSAEAERLGEIAIQLERLLYRDNHTLTEAFAVLAAAHPELARADVEQLATRLPPRWRRRKVDVEEADLTLSVPPPTADAECAEAAGRISEIVREAIDELPEDDQFVLRLRFDSDMTVPQIARALQRDAQQLYRRLYTIFGQLHEKLARAGIDASDVANLIGKDIEALDFQLKSRGTRPSEEDGSTVADGQEEIREPR